MSAAYHPSLWQYVAGFKPRDNTHYTAIAFILACLAPCFPQKSIFRRGILALQVYINVLTFLAPPPSGVANTAVLYTAGVLNGNLFARYVDRLYIHVPERDFHRVIVEAPKTQPSRIKNPGARQSDLPDHEDADNRPPIRRFLWMFEILGVTRGVGWNWRVTGIPQNPPNISRATFVRACAVKYVAMYFGLYLISLCCDGIISSFQSFQHPELRATLILLTSRSLFLYIFIVLGWALTIYSHFAILMLPLAIVCVGLQVGPKAWQQVDAWPPNFGNFRDAYSIRRFWGYTWHQQMRRIASTPGVFLLSLAPRWVQASRTRPLRLLKRYFLLLGTFLVSGLIHAAGSYNVTRARHVPVSDGGEIRYFLMQGTAIMVEDLLLWFMEDIGAQLLGGSSTLMLIFRVAGFIYTASFYVFTRVKFKCVPLTVAHGIHDERGELFAAVELLRRGVVAVPGNFVRSTLQAW